MRVLTLIGERPLPAITGTAVRHAHLWPKVARRPDVELKVLALDPQDPTRDGPPEFPGVDVEFLRYGPRSFFERVRGVVSRSWYEYPMSPALASRTDELERTWRPDVIHAEELRMAGYLPSMRGRTTSSRQTITIHNVESDLFPRVITPSVPAPLLPLATRLQIASLRRYEARAAATTDLRLAYSEHDRRRYAELYPGVSWGVTRGGTDVAGITPAPQAESPSVLILGRWSYAPNREGLRWFLDRVRPHLDPTLRVVVAGSAADATLKGWVADAGWTFHDSPIDLRPIYAEATVVAVPVLQGSGTRGKILEALAHERAIVTTTKGPEGLHLGPDEGITIADDPVEFARQLGRVAASPPAARAEPGRRGREAVRARYDWSIVADELVEAWNSCVSP